MVQDVNKSRQIYKFQKRFLCTFSFLWEEKFDRNADDADDAGFHGFFSFFLKEINP
jgi:hypothetical protein